MPRQTLKIALATLLTLSPLTAFAATAGAPQSMADRLKGYILLQVEARGQAWYVRPSDGLRYYMADGAAAYQMMRSFSLGITDADLAKVSTVATTSEMKSSASACATNAFANGVRGKILLQVQKRGEAWYVDPVKCRMIYMQDGTAAYAIMRYLSLGITNANLETIPVGTLPNTGASSSTAATTDTTTAPADTATTADTTAAAQDATPMTAADAAAESASMPSYVVPQNWNTGGGGALTDF